MRHYKIVKKGTIFTIALATLAVFLQLGLAVYTKVAFVPTKQAQAEETAVYPNSCLTTTPADIFFTYDAKQLQVNMVNKYANVGYFYQMLLYNNKDNTVISSRDGNVVQGQSPPLEIFNIEDLNDYTSSLDLVVNFTSDVSLGVQDCQSNFTQRISPFSGVAGTTALTVTPNSIDLTTNPYASFQIYYKFDNAGASYSLSITSCNGTESIKREGSRGTGFKEETFEWTPSETTNCSHEIILRGLDTSGQEIMSNTKRVTVTVGGASVADDPNAGKLDPGKLSISSVGYKLLGTEIKLSKIDSGLGDVVNIIINGLIYIIGILSLAGIVYGGILYITAGGDDAKAEKGKKTLIYSIIGIILAVLSLTIVAIIVKFPNII